MLLFIRIITATAMEDTTYYADDNLKMIVCFKDSSLIVSNMGYTVKLQNKTPPFSEYEDTVMKVEKANGKQFFIKYSNNSYLCGKQSGHDVFGCKFPSQGRSVWEIDEKKGKKARLKINEDCLTDDTLSTKDGPVNEKEKVLGSNLKLKKCKNTDEDFMWQILNVDLPKTEIIQEMIVDRDSPSLLRSNVTANALLDSYLMRSSLGRKNRLLNYLIRPGLLGHNSWSTSNFFNSNIGRRNRLFSPLLFNSSFRRGSGLGSLSLFHPNIKGKSRFLDSSVLESNFRRGNSLFDRLSF